MAKTGTKTILTDELISVIKQHILDGKILKEIASLCDIPEKTIYSWTYDNYREISDKIEGWKRDRKLLLADKNIDKILVMDMDNKDFTKVVADMSKFVKETLDKKHYSKRSELTGKEGKDLPTPIINISRNDDICTDNGHQQSTSPN